MTENEKLCVICFDELQIRSNLEYSKHLELVEDYEELGRCRKIEKKGTVFLVHGLFA